MITIGMGMSLGTKRGDKENGHALTHCCMYIQMTNLWPRAVGLAVITLEANTENEMSNVSNRAYDHVDHPIAGCLQQPKQ